MSWLSDFFNPPAANIPLPQNVRAFGYSAAPSMSPFAPTGQGGAESGMLGGIGGLSGFNTYNLPAAEATTASLYNNPFASTFLGGAGTAAGLGEAGAMNAFGAGGGLYGLGGQVARTAF